MNPRFSLHLLLFFVLASPLLAKKTHSFRTETWSPEEQLAGFELPDGFVIELVASERDGIVNPIDLSFDDAGRLWTQTALMYPLDPFADVNFGQVRKLMEDPDVVEKNPEFKRIRDLYEGRTKGDDKILIIDDPWATKPSQPRVWADGLAIPQSILPYKNGAYVAQGSELFFLDDSDGDGRADQRKRLLTGFGFIDSHTMAHLLVRAPGDWIHFSHGALNLGEVRSLVSGATARVDYSKIVRMSMDGARLNVVSSGLNNIWGFQLRANGQYYGTEANDKSWSVVPMEPGTGLQGIGNERIRPYQPWIPELHDFRVGGTGISGLAFADGMENSFPPEWKDVALLANCITSTINCVRIVRNPDGSVTAEHLPDLLQSKDDWFRPVNIEFGPDGCLYIADWYNKIISHNELPRSHPDRDYSHGRIWRIRHESQKALPIPDLFKAPTQTLVSHLKGPTLWEKRAAWSQITDRGAYELAPELVGLARNSATDVTTRIHALWSLEGIRHFDAQLMDTLVREPEDELRREAIRSLSSFDINASLAADYLRNAVNDGNAMVRSEALRTLSDLGKANADTLALLVQACRPEIPGNQLGGPYERSFERYLARMALEQYPTELLGYLDGPASQRHPVANRLWAVQALPETERMPRFLSLLRHVTPEALDQSTFIAIAGALNNSQIQQAARPFFEDARLADKLVSWSIENQSRIQSPELVRMLEIPVSLLLASSDAARQQRGLVAANQFNLSGVRDSIAKLAENVRANPASARLALQALAQNPQQNHSILGRAFRNPDAPFDIKLLALDALLRTKEPPTQNLIEAFARQATAEQAEQMANQLSTSSEGSQALLNLLASKALTESAFTLPLAQRLSRSQRQNPEAQKLLDALTEKAQREKAALSQKLDTFVAIAESDKGSPDKGKELFAALCLACHAVGKEGVGIAPPLDGSGYRDSEGLVTAILDPNAAIEPAYILRRVATKDGRSLEGYLAKQDNRGVTLRFMGGGSLFIPAESIQSLRAIAGRSFMPEGLLDGLSEEQSADLIAYIRSLK